MSESDSIKIIQEPSGDNPFLIVSKPAGLPSAPLKDGEGNNALFQASELFPVVLDVLGKKKCEHGLLHRIDTATSGLLVIATTQESYEILQNEQKNHFFIKNYRAICRDLANNAAALGGFPPVGNFRDSFFEKEYIELKTSFRPYGMKGSQVRPVTLQAGKAALKKGGSKIYSTKIFFEKTRLKSNFFNIECQIEEGYRHQIRSHLAWIGLPIAGDALYDSVHDAMNFIFEAYKISFLHPLTNERLFFSI